MLTITNKTPTKQRVQPKDISQQSEKKVLHQICDAMKKKHLLRLLELEESVLLSQQELLKSHRHSMSNIGDNEHEAQRRNLSNIKGLWRDAFRTLKTSSSGSGDDETRSSFARRFSIRKKKTNDTEQDEPAIDPVYETLKTAAETRKKTLANYLHQRQQSLNSQGSSELDIPSSPKVSRHASRTEAEIASSLRPPLPPSSQQNNASSQDNARITNC